MGNVQKRALIAEDSTTLSSNNSLINKRRKPYKTKNVTRGYSDESLVFTDSDIDEATSSDLEQQEPEGEKESEDEQELEGEQRNRLLAEEEEDGSYVSVSSDNIEIEPFDLKRELEEDLNNGSRDFNPKFKIEDQEDKWLDQLNSNKDNILKAKREQEKQEKLQKNNKFRCKLSLEHALLRLSFFMDSGKDINIFTMLARLNKLKNKYTVVNTNRKRKKGGNLENNNHVDKVHYIVNAIEYVTELISIIENKNYEGNIYEMNKLEIQEAFREETLNAKEKDLVDDDKNVKIWSFKWVKKSNKENKYFSSYEMRYWKSTYFKDNFVIVKFIDDKDIDKNWILIECIEF
ncbi:U5 snRNP complex subunit LIN1 SCDLUD_003907 [Saccharomycodes ludwigii]|uniref:U5 snRNP complex subunit LIN1 n=1 Tax=Saccharomycodes ludwigii TaxID=36035 RepID=UPI001E88D947|nr:hypothetical protein SCDLUD_003907 [Saccharomycodes ludwigii]KAH3899627.1 hypothetical protein SCDLUD_003907 [Saccharomycodes ludwigii]